jgi:CO/xanthine dehydrogenase FAD-binding subunit
LLQNLGHKTIGRPTGARQNRPKILSGGQSLIPMMKLRLARPGYLIDINRIAGLSHIKEEGGYLPS